MKNKNLINFPQHRTTEAQLHANTTIFAVCFKTKTVASITDVNNLNKTEKVSSYRTKRVKAINKKLAA